MVSGEPVLAYVRCCENASALRAPFILDPSGPTEYDYYSGVLGIRRTVLGIYLSLCAISRPNQKDGPSIHLFVCEFGRSTVQTDDGRDLKFGTQSLREYQKKYFLKIFFKKNIPNDC